MADPSARIISYAVSARVVEGPRGPAIYENRRLELIVDIQPGHSAADALREVIDWLASEHGEEKDHETP